MKIVAPSFLVLLALLLGQQAFAQKAPIRFEAEAEKLGESINSEADESAPVLSPDGKTLYFVRTNYSGNTGGKKAGQDIWYSKLGEDGNWNKAQKVEGLVNNKANNALGALSPDGQTAYVSNLYDEVLDIRAKGISQAPVEGPGRFGEPSDAYVPDSSLQGQIGFALSPDGNYWVLSYGTSEKQGEDLFLVNKNGSSPQPLTQLNTPSFDFAPSFGPEGKLLFFASGGHGAEGPCDIFVSQKTGSSPASWSKPQKVEGGVNSPGFDAYLTLDAKGEYAYFASNQDSGASDIYRIKVKPKVEMLSFIGFIQPDCPGNMKNYLDKYRKLGKLRESGAEEKGKYELLMKAKTKEKLDQKILSFFEVVCEEKKEETEGEVEKERINVASYLREKGLVEEEKTAEGEKMLTFTGFIDECPGNEKAYLAKFRNLGKVEAQQVNGQTKHQLLLEAPNPNKLDQKILDFFNIVCQENKPSTKGKKEDKELLVKQYLERKGLLEKEAIAAKEEKAEPKHVDVDVENVLFAFDSHKIQDSELPKLKKAIRLMKENDNLTLLIKGHTDHIGKKSYNKWLSKQRAKAVHDYLVDQGIANDRIRYEHHGEAKPTAPNHHSEGRQKNRRVEFHVQK